MLIFCFSNCCEKVKFSETRWLLAFLVLLAINPFLEKSKCLLFLVLKSRLLGGAVPLGDRGCFSETPLFRDRSFPGRPIIARPCHLLLSRLWTPKVQRCVQAELSSSCAQFPTAFASCLPYLADRRAGWGPRRRRMFWCSSAPLQRPMLLGQLLVRGCSTHVFSPLLQHCGSFYPYLKSVCSWK